jgi:hypothetical protein
MTTAVEDEGEAVDMAGLGTVEEALLIPDPFGIRSVRTILSTASAPRNILCTLVRGGNSRAPIRIPWMVSIGTMNGSGIHVRR